MGENTTIEWTDHTFNPWIGCAKVADGCTHCYAEAFAKRYGKAVWGPHGTRIKTSDAYWQQPISWNRSTESYPRRQRVFCASLADVFEDWDGPIHDHHKEILGKPVYASTQGSIAEWSGERRITMKELRRDLFALIDATPHLDWLLLTKRPENILRIWPQARHMPAGDPFKLNGYRPNVWLLTSIATQTDADRNIPELLKCRDLVPVLGLSCEPLLGPIDLSHHSPLDWIIVGGESGPHARPMHPEWARSLRDQCQTANVPFFFKQWGEWWPCAYNHAEPPQPIKSWYRFEPNQTMWRLGKKTAGRVLDGQEWNEFPTTQQQLADRPLIGKE